MPDYEKLYFKLFAAMADAVENLDAGNVSGARQRLIRTQQEAEEEYLRMQEFRDETMNIVLKLTEEEYKKK